ncbi:hypothetical protein [Streptomyces venezuelae]|uniref:hypothetical protein n=1 Tax=Streptomyces venezuelae TaxID=54571 RepID=UPI003F53F3DF
MITVPRLAAAAGVPSGLDFQVELPLFVLPLTDVMVPSPVPGVVSVTQPVGAAEVCAASRSAPSVVVAEVGVR